MSYDTAFLTYKKILFYSKFCGLFDGQGVEGLLGNQPLENSRSTIVRGKRFSEISRLCAEQKVIKDDISKLRKELADTKKELLQEVADSESRTTELLLRVLEEIKSLKMQST